MMGRVVEFRQIAASDDTGAAALVPERLASAAGKPKRSRSICGAVRNAARELEAVRLLHSLHRQ